MRNIIDQSNTKWRREINTVNTATQNETNRINTQLMYNISGTALNDLWQQYRDNATFLTSVLQSQIYKENMSKLYRHLMYQQIQMLMINNKKQH